jgi:penicillin-binding protein 1A
MRKTVIINRLFKRSTPPECVSEIPKPENPLRKKVLRTAIAIIATLTIAATFSAYLWLKTLGVFDLDLKNIRFLTNYSFRDNSVVFDRNGQKIGEIFDQYHVFVPLSDVPEHFIDALLAIEDKKFYEHNGIDKQGILRALLARVKSGRTTQGASTLTQQLVRNMLLTPEKTLGRKMLEISWSLEVEKQIPKNKILEIYVNSMFLGNGAYGVGAAAQRYFGKRAQDLLPEESALIAGLYQSPSRYNPAKHPERAKRRQLQVITALMNSGKITPATRQKLAEARLEYKSYRYINNQSATWFLDYIQDTLPKLKNHDIKGSRSSGLRIYTTLDSTVQANAEKSVKSHDKRLSELEHQTGRIQVPGTNQYRNATVEAAMLVTDPRNGEILAMVGGRNYSKSKFNRTISALRSPGSAFKPVVYTEALMRGYKWSDVIFVSPVNIENYRPKNLEDDYLTETTMLRAFYRSMNAPAIELAAKVGVDSIISRAKSLGVQTPIKNEVGTALGSSDVTMSDLARMYGTFAAGGMLTELSSITRITNAEGSVLWERPSISDRQKRALNSQIAFLMTQGMQSVLSSGTASKSSDLAGIAAGKTGTSNNSSDNWFCGFTPNILSIVWVGTDEHAPILSNATGGSVALPIWDQFIRASIYRMPPSAFYRPEGIVEATVHPLYGNKVASGSKMYFLNDNQPSDSASSLEHVENSSSGGYRNVFRH